MKTLFSSGTRIIEKTVQQKTYFSEQDQITVKDKCYMGILSFLVVLFWLNIYQLIVNATVIEIVL